MRKKERKRVLLISIYSHIEYYPPSLNALFHLAPLFDEVYILVRNIIVSQWKYPENVYLIPVGEFIDPLKLKGYRKVTSLLAFGFTFRKYAILKKPQLILVYDSPAYSLLNICSWRISKRMKSVIWYHSHDVFHENDVPKYSILWISRLLELRFIERCDIFTLPNKTRLAFFPLSKLKRKPFILPNYPSSHFYGKWRSQPLLPKEPLRIIFQGHISEPNGIENIVALLQYEINGRRIELHLAGPVDVNYKNKLLEIGSSKGVAGNIHFYGRIPYHELPSLTASCHIGIAIYGQQNIMVRTMSTASNKIFEYACVGLPVIINDRSDMKEEFSNYGWIKFSDLGVDSLLETLRMIERKHDFFSLAALNDTDRILNFEFHINPVLKTITDLIREREND